MKVPLLLFAIALAVGMVPAVCPATSVGTGTIEQPINLGSKSDPRRIPLGRVGTISNYNYGIHSVICAPRPCPDEAMRWDGGTELDQNLASVFGISVEPEDSTTVPGRPVTLRMNSWRPPGYTPYSKEQVLAATLWCLIRSAGGTPEGPLDVRVVAEALEDRSLEAKYSGKYITRPGKDGKDVPPVKIPGAVIERDARGIDCVVFPEVTKKPKTPVPLPMMIPFEMEGEFDDGGGGVFVLLPVWENGEHTGVSLGLNHKSASICYDRFHSTGRIEANSFLAAGGVSYFTASNGENGDLVNLGNPRAPQATLAAAIIALIVADQPTETRPLTIKIWAEESVLAKYPAFRAAPGWKEIRNNPNNITLECQFVWDAAARKLTKGFVPLVKLTNDRTIVTDRSEVD